MEIQQIALLFGGWTIITTGIIAYLAKGFSNKLTANWDNQNKQQQIILQGQIDKIQGLSSHLLSTHSTGYHLAQQKRIEAVEKIWKGVLSVRTFSDPLGVIYRVLSEEQIESVFKEENSNAPVLVYFEKLNLNKLIDIISSQELEINKQRIFVTTELYNLYKIYSFFTVRSIHLLQRDKMNRNATIWKKDKRITDLLRSELSPEEMDIILNTNTDSYNLIADLIESKILYHSSKVLNGELAVETGIEQVKKLHEISIEKLTLPHSSSLST